MTKNITNKNSRNQSIEITKFIAACFVVFLHIRFPGKVGEVVVATARFAVPFFFAVSGYYAYNAREDVILKRMIKIFKLNVLSSALYAIYGLYEAHFITRVGCRAYIKSTLSLRSLSKLLFMNISPFVVVLWYLAAMFIAYLILYLYVKFWKNKPQINYKYLYVVSAFLIILRIFLSINLKISDIKLHNRTDRTSLFFAIPNDCNRYIFTSIC